MIDYLNDRQSAPTAGCSDKSGSIRRIRKPCTSSACRSADPRRRQDVRAIRAGIHGDHHGLWIDPANPNIIYSSNDGGFYQTADAGKSWRFAVAAGGAQFYNVEIDRARRPGPTARFRTSAAGAVGRTSIAADAARSAVALNPRPAARARNHAIDPTNPKSCIRTVSTATSAALIFSRRARGGRGRGSRHDDPAGGSRRPSSAPSGWRLSSFRRTTTASCMRAIRSCSGREIAATAGKKSATI